jgi:hypothetical protein
MKITRHVVVKTNTENHEAPQNPWHDNAIPNTENPRRHNIDALGSAKATETTKTNAKVQTQVQTQIQIQIQIQTQIQI